MIKNVFTLARTIKVQDTFGTFKDRLIRKKTEDLGDRVVFVTRRNGKILVKKENIVDISRKHCVIEEHSPGYYHRVEVA